MLRHYLSLAFRHVARNKPYALISITGPVCSVTILSGAALTFRSPPDLVVPG